MKLLTVVLFLAVAAGERLDSYHQGEVCKEENGLKWTCKKLSECSKCLHDLNNYDKVPQLCNSKGATEDIVCCDPQEVRSPPVGVKSKQKCEEYSAAVHVEEEGADGEILYRDSCAATEPLVTNGNDTDPAEFPHMALIGFEDEGITEWLCGGSLISDEFVLSAAHCRNAGSTRPAKWVRLGEHNLAAEDDDGQIEDYEIQKIIIYPLYNESSDYHDIALYKLSRKVEFTEFIRPLCLQTEHQFPKTYVIATGWGRKMWGGPQADILQKVNLTITPRENCSEAYTGTLGLRVGDGVKDDIMFCAGDTKNRKDTCQSDSGGPLQNRLVLPYCMYSLVGVTSFGSKCGSTVPGGYTRVSAYVSWIECKVWPDTNVNS